MNEFRPYLLTWAILLALLATVIAGAQLLSGLLALAVISAGALCMVGLIIFMFMGLRDADALAQVFGVGGVLWLGFLIVLTLADYLTR